jgi:DNA repair photolyase
VCISPATDPFMPLVEVQAETARVVAVLAEHGVEAWLLTRGLIRPAAFDVLVKHRQRVKVTVGMTTADPQLSRLLEPLAAPPRLRLRQLGRLRDAGIAVSVQVAPLVPRLTDRRANLEELVDALAKVGVQRITVGYMFLRSGIRDNLLAVLQTQGLDESLLHDYETGPLLTADGIAAARYLPKARRQQGYAALMALAAPRGIRVSICGLTNPDFTLAPSRSGR